MTLTHALYALATIGLAILPQTLALLIDIYYVSPREQAASAA